MSPDNDHPDGRKWSFFVGICCQILSDVKIENGALLLK
jgi:hypothetical protein